jgi:signal transduction histidine kinase
MRPDNLVPPQGTAYCGDRQHCPLAEYATRLNEQHEALARQERLAVLGQLAAGLAHEIRNPLASIRGFCQLLDGLVTDEKSRGYLKVLVHEVDRMNNLIGEFVRMARPHAPQIVEVDLNVLVRETLALVDSRCFLSRVEVRKHLREIPTVLIDRDKIKQVLLNLINNAIEAMEYQDRPRVLTVSTVSADRTIRVNIEDTGCGIPENVLKNIGTPFFSTKKTGTGLGLFICHQLVSEHGGTITVRSREGTGTRFTVSLPRKL